MRSVPRTLNAFILSTLSFLYLTFEFIDIIFNKLDPIREVVQKNENPTSLQTIDWLSKKKANKRNGNKIKQLMLKIIDDYHKYINKLKLMGQCKCATACYQKEEITSLKISTHSIQISIKQHKNYQDKISDKIEPPNQKDLDSGILKNSINSKISIQELSKNLILQILKIYFIFQKNTQN